MDVETSRGGMKTRGGSKGESNRPEEQSAGGQAEPVVGRYIAVFPRDRL